MTSTRAAVVLFVATLTTLNLGAFHSQTESSRRLEVRDAQISPDGRWVVFTRGEERTSSATRLRSSVWRVPFAGGDPQPLTTTASEDSRPRWSPDGDQIAFLSRSLDPVASTRIFVTPSSGGLSSPVTPESFDVAAFEWSPVGRRIAYVVASAAGRGLWFHDVGGAAAARPLLAGLFVTAFSWSPTGSSIAATVDDAGSGGARLAIVSVFERSVPRFSSNGFMPTVGWSPDGVSIALLGQSVGVGSRVVLVQASGKSERTLTIASEGRARDVSWTGDGRLSLAFASGEATWIELLTPGTGERIIVMPIGIATLTSSPSWSRDGSRYVVVGRGSEHPPEVFAGAVPMPESGLPDVVGARPPPVRRLTISNPTS